jgi:transposase
MVTYTPHFKHSVLRQYAVGIRGHSYRDLAYRYDIQGGPSLIRKWYQHWDGSRQSLERTPGSGRRVLLTPQQVQQYIVRPIRRKNQDHIAISYPELKDNIEQKIGHSISVRTVRRHGRDEGHITSHSTVPRTEQERKFMHNIIDIVCN